MRARDALRAAVAAAALLAAALGSSGAGAQSPADVAAARELFKEASRLAQEEKWAEARERYERSLKLKRAAITLYSLGVAQHKTGHLVEALESFRAFLAEPVAPATEPWQQPARESVAELEKRVARLTIEIAPPGLEGLVLKVDGQDVPSAALDRARLVNPGAHEVVASAKGHREARTSGTVAEGGQLRVKLALEPAPEAAAPSPPSAPSAGPLPASPPPAGPTGPAADRAETPSLALPFALIGGGVAALGAGIAVGMVGVSQASDAPTNDGPDADSARTKMLIGDILGGVGIASAGVGVIVLLVRSGSSGPKTAQPARPWRLDPWIGGRATGVRVRF